MRSALVAFVEYLLGFLALAFFAFLAFGAAPVSDATLLFAFKASAPIAVAELAVLLLRPSPVNRLIVGANLWLCAGGLAAFFEQWWWLKGYQQLGEASLFISMLAVGVATTVLSPAGFVAAHGRRRHIVLASVALLVAVFIALLAAIHFRCNVKFAAVLPVISLSWLSRLLKRAIPGGA